MDILTAVLFGTGISLIISAFVIAFIGKQMQKCIKIEDCFDRTVLESLKYLEERIDNLEIKEEEKC